MAEKRVVLVGSISYRGTDGEDHVGVLGEHINVAKEGLAAFDFIHGSTPEAQAEERRKVAEEAEKAKTPPASKVDKA